MPLTCPKCLALIESTLGGDVPGHCRSCGSPIFCAECGRQLERHDEDSQVLFCRHCDRVASENATADQMTIVLARDHSPPGIRVGGALDLPGYEVLGEIGRGGMGIVYRARQTSVDRDVAIKVLNPQLAADADMLSRFRSEALIAGSMTDAHILPVFDVLDDGGVPAIVMPLIDGTDLGRIVKDRFRLRHQGEVENPHPWAKLPDRDYLMRVLPVLDKLVDGVAVMHAGEVLHRDIKPSNVLLDQRGNVWISDFGLSRLGERRLKTTEGVAVGTFGYMSPEQAAGEFDLDERTDLFALGVTLYQTLTLELPFGRNGAKPADPLPAPPSKRQQLLSRDLDAVIFKAIEPDRRNRYRTTAELRDDWFLARQGLLPRARRLSVFGRFARSLYRHRWPALAATLLLAVVGLLAELGLRGHADARQVNRTIALETIPPGATAVLVPIDDEPYDATDGYPLPEQAIRAAAGQVTPLTLKDVPPGRYLVVVALPDGRFHEVFRAVPGRGEVAIGSFPHQSWTEMDSGVIQLPRIEIPNDRPELRAGAEMCLLDAGEFEMGEGPPVGHANTPHLRQVAAFYLDPTEVTIGQYRRVAKYRPTAYRRFEPPPADELPVSFVTYDEAVAFAEKSGKRLPTEAEYEYAATLGGMRRFPWGDDAKSVEDWRVFTVGQPEWDQTSTQPPVFGLYSNVAEWTSSMQGPYPTAQLPPIPVLEEFKADMRQTRVIRGAPWFVVVGFRANESVTSGPRSRIAITRSERHPGLGFRCARSQQPPYLNP